MSAVKLHAEHLKAPRPLWFLQCLSRFHLYGVRKSHMSHLIIGIEWYFTCLVNRAFMCVAYVHLLHLGEQKENVTYVLLVDIGYFESS